MPIVEDLQQRTDEWLAMRCGCFTASRCDDGTAKLKSGKYSERRQDYLTEVVYERLTGLHFDHYVSPAMEYGTEQEPFARAAYETARDVLVEEVGLAIHPSVKGFVASPDGLVGNDGCIEIKVPNIRTHIEWLLAGDVPPEHIPQIKAVLACTGRQWCDFISYSPKLPPYLRLFICRLERDEAKIREMEAEVVKFLQEVDAMVERLRSLQ